MYISFKNCFVSTQTSFSLTHLRRISHSMSKHQPYNPNKATSANKTQLNTTTILPSKTLLTVYLRLENSFLVAFLLISSLAETFLSLSFPATYLKTVVHSARLHTDFKFQHKTRFITLLETYSTCPFRKNQCDTSAKFTPL